jgi:hypothetical protein
MYESLRSVGYDLETAVADIVDNSISAHATRIDISFEWAGADSWVRVSDNGHGMAEDELREAMRLGSRSPLEERGPEDLGRFGLGLKTASFSQCRRLTLRSHRAGEESRVRCWDLDLVQDARDWIVLDQPQSAASDIALGDPPTGGGTVVLWEILDRIVQFPDDSGAHDHFLRRVEQTHKHLAMVFHRFLAGRQSILLTINGVRVDPWDPFMTHHPATQVLPDTVLGDGANELLVRPYILPHESKLTVDEHRNGAGPRGWNAQQGFYLYRNRRLILSGNWLGLFQQEEHNKLARIQLDIQNTLDHLWQVDVRKASASPPPRVRRQLHQIAQETRQKARKVYGHRGASIRARMDDEIVPVWEERTGPDGAHVYRLNRRHRLVRAALESSDKRALVASALRLVEETVPVNLITARFNEQTLSQDAPFERAEREMVDMIDAVGSGLCGALSPERIREELLRLEPFAHYPDLVAAARFCEELYGNPK